MIFIICLLHFGNYTIKKKDENMIIIENIKLNTEIIAIFREKTKHNECNIKYANDVESTQKMLRYNFGIDTIDNKIIQLWLSMKKIKT